MSRAINQAKEAREQLRAPLQVAAGRLAPQISSAYKTLRNANPADTENLVLLAPATLPDKRWLTILGSALQHYHYARFTLFPMGTGKLIEEVAATSAQNILNAHTSSAFVLAVAQIDEAALGKLDLFYKNLREQGALVMGFALPQAASPSFSAKIDLHQQPCQLWAPQ